MRTVDIDTPHGPARAHVDRASASRGALAAAARELRAGSTSTYAADRLTEDDKQAAFRR